MNLQNIVLKSAKWNVAFVLLFCFFTCNQGFAQSDREMIIQERERVENSKKMKSPRPHSEYTEEENSYAPREANKYSTSSSKTNRSGYHEEGTSMEDKKEDKTPVSFNIFLYVLDRFKEN